MFSLSGSWRYEKGPAYEIIESLITSEEQIVQHYGSSFIVVDDVEAPEATDTGEENLVWEQHIKELFTDQDKKEMEKRGINLHDYEQVRKNADRILYQVKKHMMPTDWPAGVKPWDENKIKKFRRWVELGMPKNRAIFFFWKKESENYG